MPRLVLKVDIDTKIGLLDGVPRLLEILSRAGDIKASFFVAMGPDNSGRAFKRLLRPGFLRKQLKARAAGSYGLATMMYGIVVPGPVIASQAPGLFRAMLAKGHEVGLHGWDHVYWHDKMRCLPPALIRNQLSQAMRLFSSINGFKASAFAAPGWQVTDEAWQIMAEMGITHTSCVRGRVPFRPVVKGKALPLLEIPTTMPSLDEAMGACANAKQAVDWLAGQIKADELNVFTLHGEVEGRNFAPQFRSLLARLQDMGVEFITLRAAALATLRNQRVAAGTFRWGTVANRAGQLALQV